MAPTSRRGAATDPSARATVHRAAGDLRVPGDRRRRRAGTGTARRELHRRAVAPVAGRLARVGLCGDRQRRWEQQVRTVTYRAVNVVVDKAGVVVADDLSRTFAGRRKRGADTNRRLAAWTKGLQHRRSLPVRRAKHPISINTDQGIESSRNEPRYSNHTVPWQNKTTRAGHVRDSASEAQPAEASTVMREGTS
jgi:hypothetical protein